MCVIRLTITNLFRFFLSLLLLWWLAEEQTITLVSKVCHILLTFKDGSLDIPPPSTPSSLSAAYTHIHTHSTLRSKERLYIAMQTFTPSSPPTYDYALHFTPPPPPPPPPTPPHFKRFGYRVDTNNNYSTLNNNGWGTHKASMNYKQRSHSRKPRS